MPKQLFNINEANAIKLEECARILNKTKTMIVNELIAKKLVLDYPLVEEKINEILRVIEKQQKELLEK